MAFVTDNFTGTDATDLTAHTADSGATWTEHTSYVPATMAFDIRSNRIRQVTGGSVVGACSWASASPAGADYTVVGIIRCVSTANSRIGVAGRIDTTVNTMYCAEHDSAADVWRLIKMVAGVQTSLGTFAQTLSASTSYEVRLRMYGTSIKLLVDGVEQIAVVDSDITAAGKAGVRGQLNTGAAGGLHLDAITATDIVVHERSSVVEATGAVATVALYFTTLERTAALASAAAIATASTFWTEFTRAAAIDATAALQAAPQRDLARQAALAATGGIQISGTVSTVLTGSAALGGVASIQATGLHEHPRSAALSATGAVSAGFQRELGRSATIAAASAIAVAGEIEAGPVTHERTAAISGAGAIASAGAYWSTLERQGALSATAALTAAGSHDVVRSVSIAASGAVASVGSRELLRSCALSATAALVTAGDVVGIRERSAAIGAVTAIESVGRIAEELDRAIVVAALAQIDAGGRAAFPSWPGRTDSDWPEDTDTNWDADADDRWLAGVGAAWSNDTDDRW